VIVSAVVDDTHWPFFLVLVIWLKFFDLNSSNSHVELVESLVVELNVVGFNVLNKLLSKLHSLSSSKKS